MYIKNLKIKNPLFLAPMAGITDHPFRVLCKKKGVGVVYTEFVSANGVVRKNLKTLELVKFTQDERPIGVQIFGDDPEIVGRSSKIIFDMFKPDIIDINYGCPVPKVTKHGAGSAALKDLCLMEEITLSVIESVPSVPVTVKMRSGWDERSIVSSEVGPRLEKIGVSAITLHPRTTKQQFSGKSNWNLIKDLKQSVNIPVIGNGDVKNAHDYKQIKKITSCDGVMIGRAALGNPWIFDEIMCYEKNKIFIKPSIYEIIKMCKEHYILLREEKNDNVSVNLAKKHFFYYLKGFNDASVWRKKIMRAVGAKDIYKIIKTMENTFSN